MVRHLVLWSCVLVASTAVGADPRWDKLSLPGGQQKVAPEVVAVFRAELVGERSLGVEAIDISPDGTWVVHDSGPDRICVRNIADLSKSTIIQLKAGQLPRAGKFYFSDDSRVMFHAGDTVAWDISLTPPAQNTVLSRKVDRVLGRGLIPFSVNRAIGIPEAEQGVTEVWDTSRDPPTLVAPVPKDILLQGEAMGFHAKTNRIAIVTVRNAQNQKDIQTHVHVFSAVDGQEIARQMIPNGMFQGVSFSPSGQQIITTSGEFFQAGVVQVHSISAQGQMKLDHSLTGDGKFVPTVWARFVNDGTEVMCVTSNRIVIIDAKMGLVSRTIEGIGGDINALAPDGKHLVTGYSRSTDLFVVRVAKKPENPDPTP